MGVETVIRPSMTTGWFDCGGRQAAKSYRKEIEAAGYVLRDTPTHVAAPIGSAVHAAAERMNTAKMNGHQALLADCVDYAMIVLDERMAENEVVHDQITPNRNDAQHAVRRMSSIYQEQIVSRIQPIGVERTLKADAGDGFIISGTSDLLTLEPDHVRDTKTGAQVSAHPAQLGSYARLAVANGIAVSEDGQTVYVSDSNHGRVTAFSPDGEVRWQVGTIAAGMDDDSDRPLQLPRGLCVESDGSILVTDAFSFEVVRISAEGEILTRFGDRGVEAGQWNFANDVAPFRSFALVADKGNERVQMVRFSR